MGTDAAWNRRELWYIRGMRTPAIVVLFAALGLSGCGQRESAKPPQPTNAGASGNPLTAPADYAGAVVQARQHAAKVVDLTSLKQAIRMFQAQEDRYPKDLDELVKQQYLPSLPKPPTGMKFQYDAKTGDVKVVATP